MNDEDIMRQAISEASLSVEEGSVPFACVVIDRDRNVVLREHDRVQELRDPTAHGEINAIRKLCKEQDTLSLRDYTFFTTSEPCPTCLSSLIKAKVERVIYGCKTEKTASLPISAEQLAALATRKIDVIGGVLEQECLSQRDSFFNKNQ